MIPSSSRSSTGAGAILVSRDSRYVQQGVDQLVYHDVRSSVLPSPRIFGNPGPFEPSERSFGDLLRDGEDVETCPDESVEGDEPRSCDVTVVSCRERETGDEVSPVKDIQATLHAVNLDRPPLRVGDATFQLVG